MTREDAIEKLKRADITVGCKVKTKTAEALEMAIQLLKQEPCDNAISRQAVIDAMRKNHRSGGRDIDGDYIEGDYRECLYDDIISLPPVTPQESKMGHWIMGKYKDTCNKCRCTYPKNIGFKNFCPNCGAKMVEPQETEDKE